MTVLLVKPSNIFLFHPISNLKETFFYYNSRINNTQEQKLSNYDSCYFCPDRIGLMINQNFILKTVIAKRGWKWKNRNIESFPTKNKNENLEQSHSTRECRRVIFQVFSTSRSVAKNCVLQKKLDS